MWFESVFTNYLWERPWIRLWSLWQKFHQSFNLEIHIQTLNEHWTEITAVYENKNFNCDQCGKYFARWCNLKVLIQNVFMKFIHELWTLWQIFNQSIQFVGNLSQNQNSEAQRHYDCDSCGRSSTQLENLNT